MIRSSPTRDFRDSVRIVHLLLSECLVGKKNVLYEAYLEARIVTPFNQEDPDPGWTEYELASREEFAVVVFVSGKGSMADLLVRWTEKGWKKELDDDPELKKLVCAGYYVSATGAVGDDYGFTTSTLTEESDAVRRLLGKMASERSMG